MVKISKAAKDDLKQIYEFISRDSVIYAHKVVQSIFKSIKNLENFPESGRIVPELNDISIREIIHDPYRIIYRVKDSVEVIAIIHAKRDFENATKGQI
jgi:addiction module RelE/StbE family toxin